MKRHWIRYLPEWCRTMASQANQSLHRWGNTWLSPQVTLMVHVGPDPGIVDDWILCFPDIWSSNLFRTQSNIFHLSVSSTLQEFAVWNLKLPPYPEGKERLKRERDQSRLASSRFNKQADLHLRLVFSSIQFSSVSHSCPMLCDPMDSSTSGLPVHQQLLEHTQTHVHCNSDAIQPSHPLLSPSPPTFNLSQHQGLFKWVSSSHQGVKILEFQLQH